MARRKKPASPHRASPRHIGIGTPQGVARAISGCVQLATLIERLPEELSGASVVVVPEHPYRQFVVAYFEGESTALDNIPRRQENGEFATKIWQSIGKIPYGKTISYKELATLASRSSAVRAAGTACSLNKLVLLVPCHSIVRSNGQLGEYLYGAKIKEHLLKIEGNL